MKTQEPNLDLDISLTKCMSTVGVHKSRVEVGQHKSGLGQFQHDLLSLHAAIFGAKHALVGIASLPSSAQFLFACSDASLGIFMCLCRLANHVIMFPFPR